MLNMLYDKPWDARLAYRIIYPLRNSTLTPNHLTWIRLFFGVFACLALAEGSYFWTNVGSIFFVLSNFLDHTDGEFARLTGKISKSGHYFDLASDAAVNILLFLGIGIGLMGSSLGDFAMLMGIIAGLAVAAIFHMRLYIENHIGKEQARQPHFSGIEAEDILYLLPVITFFEQLFIFLLLASIGAPLFCIWVLKEYLGLRKKQTT